MQKSRHGEGNALAVEIRPVDFLSRKSVKIDRWRITGSRAQQRFVGDDLFGKRIDDRLKSKAAFGLLQRSFRVAGSVFYHKLPAFSLRNFVIVFLFRGFDEGTEKMERSVVIGELIFCGPFIQHSLQHFIAVKLS